MNKIVKKTAIATGLALSGIQVAHAAAQPNILVIFGDDIGYGNISAYNQGMLGYQTPNIDSIANDGALFTSYYGQQSCTAGRSAFITGQMPVRTGLTKVGLPGAKQGLQAQDITLAQTLKDQGYVTGQFGKNHLGDRDDMLPTNHGFDEFFGNLYHLNAEEEPENADYPKDPTFRKNFGPRGVIHSYADGKIEDTGPLTRKRMETVDEETMDAAMDFMTRAVKADKPFFTWYNATRMHIKTHVKAENSGKTGLGDYADGMVEHDNIVGDLLDKVDDLGISDNTVIIYTTDNGPMNATWPDAAFSPFRGEKNTGWEGGFRVPAVIKWPGHIKAGTKLNGMFAGEDWLPTLTAIAGNNDIKQELLKGYKADNGKTYKNHLDGYNQVNYLTGKSKESARQEFFYWSDDGELLAMRDGRWKMHFKIQENQGWKVWTREFTNLRIPMIFDLQVDPYEKADQGFGYDSWVFDHVFLLVPTQAKVAKMIESFKEFPPRQEIPSFSVDKVMEQMKNMEKVANASK
ncbi:sulfatase-like hydrolase/transferase [Aliivibrio fischeri]|uniref:arylsulfatase n=1 Tax=Aliivibrio fischeri TaxID=668 RepID=UPI0012D87837|nr:arylsulfatase [Aliivibrio fischeri]MUK63074.1 sulfatase-like hydrolase/transferase [Aliivibrio fischeri]MUK70001.1 sulfatase-like hydrolase/transferase [Aliivibrio fischeri]MUK72535.1 sulfatase-like hydrolase/transferase [Aliivibrio fischeri]MUK77781.1 sulfatase-like hydrolase/transferase [Aliivibrio fischeri]MUL20309.1 sulfatase-like hydrolase/transferase [Aliivibrio fischeri]